MTRETIREIQHGTGPTKPIVFISYTGEDLAEYAKQAALAVRRLGWTADDHQEWVGNGRPALEECLARVRAAQVLVLLVAHRYGSIPDEERSKPKPRSFVRCEYEEAVVRGLEIVPLLADEDQPWPPKQIEARLDPRAGALLEDFKALVGKGVRQRFTNKESVHAEVSAALALQKDKLDPQADSGSPRVAIRARSAIEAYLRRTADEYARIPLLSFEEQPGIAFDIESQFQSLGIAHRAGSQAATGEIELFAKRGPGGRETYQLDGLALEDVYRVARERDATARGVVLLGEPGSGKSTAARRFAWGCARNDSGSEALSLPRGTIPILLRIRELEPKHLDGGLLGWLRCVLANPHAGVEETADLCQALWEAPRVLWILDGLDELPDATLVERTSTWIRKALEHRKEHRFLVTSRYTVWSDTTAKALGASFVAFEIKPLSDEQQAAFASAWFKAVERGLRVDLDEASRLARAGEESECLAAVLRQADRRSTAMAEMTANPLLLSILCLVFRETQDLPRQRAKVYERCVEVLLDKWRRELRRTQARPAFDPDAARRVLQQLAWWMHSERDRALAPEGECAKIVEDALATAGEKTELGRDGQAFLDRVRRESGLIARGAPGRLQFLHLTFQEFLAARHASEHQLARELAGRFAEERWQEVILLCLSQAPLPFAEAFFEHLVRTQSVEEDEARLDLILNEAQQVPVGRLTGLMESGELPAARLRTLLRALAARTDPGLRAVARRLVEKGEPNVREAAALVLQRHMARVAPGLAAVIAERAIAESGLTLAAMGAASWIHAPSSIELVSVPAGKFEMGAERTVYADERPVHRVRVAAFLFAKNPVTNREYARFLEAKPDHRAPAHWKDRRYNQPDQPVVGVSWEDAKAFCVWSGLRLPSEAEWEYACRAGTPTEYWSGDAEKDLKRVGWFVENSDKRLHAVGEKPASPWGLHDVHGNVWEWCEDTWHESYDGAPVDGSAWIDKATVIRVFRGGSFEIAADRARSAYRNGDHPGNRWASVGFRPALSIHA